MLRNKDYELAVKLGVIDEDTANKCTDDVQDNCCYESDRYKAWYKEWCKKIKENAPIECKK